MVVSEVRCTALLSRADGRFARFEDSFAAWS
jgi:hypothetical protein